MTLVTLSLSDTELVFAREQAAEKGFPAVEDYIHDLLKAQIQKGQEDVDRLVPQELRVTSKGHLETKVLEAMSGSGRVMTRKDFAEMRRELIDFGAPEHFRATSGEKLNAYLAEGTRSIEVEGTLDGDEAFAERRERRAPAR